MRVKIYFDARAQSAKLVPMTNISKPKADGQTQPSLGTFTSLEV